MHSAAFRRWSGLAAVIALCGGLGLAGASARAGEDPGQVTSVIGDTRANDAQLAGGANEAPTWWVIGEVIRSLFSEDRP